MQPSARLPASNRPTCPNCKKVFDRTVEMRGPTPHPNDPKHGVFFVCDRCNHTMKERRSAARGRV